MKKNHECTPLRTGILDVMRNAGVQNNPEGTPMPSNDADMKGVGIACHAGGAEITGGAEMDVKAVPVVDETMRAVQARVAKEPRTGDLFRGRIGGEEVEVAVLCVTPSSVIGSIRKRSVMDGRFVPVDGVWMDFPAWAEKVAAVEAFAYQGTVDWDFARIGISPRAGDVFLCVGQGEVRIHEVTNHKVRFLIDECMYSLTREKWQDRFDENAANGKFKPLKGKG